MTTITVLRPTAVKAPRAAAWAANLFVAALSWFKRREQARTERREVADREAQAAQLRDYAQRLVLADPRFAADLFAAADRHERGG